MSLNLKEVELIEEILPEKEPTESKSNIFFATKKETQSTHYLKGEPVSLVCLNIPSYMGGRAFPWESNP